MLKTEKNYNDVFLIRDIILKRQGYKSYQDFLSSDYWKAIKLKVQQPKYRDTYNHCSICKVDHNIHLHHHNYRWLLTKYELRSICALCECCHQTVHRIGKAKNIPLNQAYDILRNTFF